MSARLRFTVYGRDLTRVGPVEDGDPGSCTIRHNKPGEGALTVPAGHLRVPALAAAGARCVVEYRPAGAPWMRLMSGPVHEVEGFGGPAATRTFAIRDDKAILWELAGWPRPDQPITNQGGDGTHWTASGPAETVLKSLVAANAGRWGLPVVVAPDQGRGSTIDVAIRMVPLADKLFPAVEQAGLGVSVIQDDAAGALVVDVYPMREHTKVLTESSGVVQGSGAFSVVRPTVGSVLVLAGGEGEARVMRRYVDTARIADWGPLPEVVRDARDVSATDPALETLLAARGQEVLTEGAGSASLDLQLAETPFFRFGAAVQLGDVIQARVAGSDVLTDVVREVEVTLRARDGLRVVPVVGERTDTATSVLGKKLAALARGQRDLQAGR